LQSPDRHQFADHYDARFPTPLRERQQQRYALRYALRYMMMTQDAAQQHSPSGPLLGLDKARSSFLPNLWPLHFIQQKTRACRVVVQQGGLWFGG
jgi:hypothetical protein